MPSQEARHNAQKLKDYRLRIIQERWLSTVILTVHLEIEAILTEILCKTLPAPTKLFGSRNVGFAQKLALCEAHRSLDIPLAAGIRAVNTLRNQLAHALNDVPTV